MDSETLWTLLLGGGGTALVGGLIQAYRGLRTDASKKARESIEDLERWRDSANASREAAEQARDEALRKLTDWRAYAGALEYHLISRGIEMPPNAKRPDS